MQEPEIKYENCEEIYPIPPATIANDGGGCVNTSQMPHKRNYIEHMQSNSLGSTTTLESEPFAINFNTPICNPPIGSHSFYGTPQLTSPNTDVTKVKRQRRYESNILFQHPFFNLMEDWDSAKAGEAITAKCLSCKVTLRGHKNVSSNFIKHMKRLHPDLYKVYENYKLLKYKGWALTDSVSTGQSNNETIFDSSAFLEQITNASVEEPNSTETSSTPPTMSLEQSNVLPQINEAVSLHPGGGDTGEAGAVRVVPQEKILNSNQSRSEVDLSSRTLQQMSKMLDSKLNGFVTLAQLQVERKTMLQLIDDKVEEIVNQSQLDSTSTAPTATPAESPKNSIQSQIDSLKLECQQLRDAVKRLQLSKRRLQEEMQAIDQTIRQRKIIIRNMSLQATEKPKEAAERLIKDFLQIPDIQIKNAITLQSLYNKAKPSIIIELQKLHDYQQIMKNCRKLKNTGIMIESVLGPYALRRKHKLLVLRRELLRRNAELKVSVKNAKLFVGGKEFYWDVVDGLCAAHDSNETTIILENSGADLLKTVTGLEMNEFLSVLKNYNLK